MRGRRYVAWDDSIMRIRVFGFVEELGGGVRNGSNRFIFSGDDFTFNFRHFSGVARNIARSLNIGGKI